MPVRWVAGYRMKDRSVSDGNRWVRDFGLKLAHFSGFARAMESSNGGLGVILRFERVRPARKERFQPLKSREVTPEFLERTLHALKRWKFDVVSMDEICRRLGEPVSGKRFVSLTFDGGYRDVVTAAYPVLSRHQVPFAVYVPTAFPDGLGEAWWLALEQVISKHDRISLAMDGKNRHFVAESYSEKQQLYDLLHQWMQRLSSSDLSAAVNDLCKRYSVDLDALSRDASMTWSDITKLAADPLVTIGTTTVNYPTLTAIKDVAALREMTMGRAVGKAALGRDAVHFAYPFGDKNSFGRQHVVMAEEAKFASAVSAVPGVVRGGDQSSVYALPRIAWDGRQRSLIAMRVILSGLTVR